MTGPFHAFVVMPVVGSREMEWQEQVSLDHPQRISDDVVHFMFDSLRWVETRNPAQENSHGRGLNLYGPTRIEGDNAALLAKLLRAWASVFQCGPAFLELATASEGEANKFRRDEVIDSLNEVAALAEEASREGYWLLHLGV